MSAITKDEIKTLEILGFFFYNMGFYAKAEHLSKALIAVDPDNTFAKNLLVAIAFGQGKFEDVLLMTKNMSASDIHNDKDMELCKLRARALFKLGDTDKAKALMNDILKEHLDDTIR